MHKRNLAKTSKTSFEIALHMTWALAVVAILTGATTQTATAGVFSLDDRNSSVQINTESDLGMFSWTVDDVEQIFQQWLWYRIGNGGPELPINTLEHDDNFDTVVSDGDFDPGDERLVARYFSANETFEIQVDYLLTGGIENSGTSDVAEVIRVSSLTDEPLSFRLFQYTDFDLGGSTDDAVVRIDGGNTALQRDVSPGPGEDVFQSETVATPKPTRFEAGTAIDILSKLNDGDSDTLNNNDFTIGPADLAWAFQWNFTLQPRGTFIISKDKNIVLVPEPSTVALFGMGLFGLAVFFRRSRRA